MIDIKLKRTDRTYKPGDIISGVVVVNTKGSMSHNGIDLFCDGVVQLQLSSKNVGVFEAFYNSIKPINMINFSVNLAKPGKIPDGISEIPFEFRLEPAQGQQFYETYHGVFVNVSYLLRAELKRSFMSKDLSKTLEFIVEVKTKDYNPADSKEGVVVPFAINPEKVDSARKKPRAKPLPAFELDGQLDSACCDIRTPFTGLVTVKESEAPIKSIEVQLVRVETCGCAEGYAKETTEIQNIQVAEGDVARGIPIRLHMIFPRLFTCPSVAAKTFKVEFEVNIVVMFEDNHLITESFPIKLIRK